MSVAWLLMSNVIYTRLVLNANRIHLIPLFLQGTNNPYYSRGQRDASSGVLEVTLGGRDNDVIQDGMSGGWSYIFTLLEETRKLTVNFDYELFLSRAYESFEYVALVVSLDGSTEKEIVLVNGKGMDDKVISESEEKATFLAVPAGIHKITIGLYNNQKTQGDEFTTLRISAISILAATG